MLDIRRFRRTLAVAGSVLALTFAAGCPMEQEDNGDDQQQEQQENDREQGDDEDEDGGDQNDDQDDQGEDD